MLLSSNEIPFSPPFFCLGIQSGRLESAYYVESWNRRIKMAITGHYRQHVIAKADDALPDHLISNLIRAVVTKCVCYPCYCLMSAVWEAHIGQHCPRVVLLPLEKGLIGLPLVNKFDVLTVVAL
jgi:hypothetical protein